MCSMLHHGFAFLIASLNPYHCVKTFPRFNSSGTKRQAPCITRSISGAFLRICRTIQLQRTIQSGRCIVGKILLSIATVRTLMHPVKGKGNNCTTDALTITRVFVCLLCPLTWAQLTYNGSNNCSTAMLPYASQRFLSWSSLVRPRTHRGAFLYRRYMLANESVTEKCSICRSLGQIVSLLCVVLGEALQTIAFVMLVQQQVEDNFCFHLPLTSLLLKWNSLNTVWSIAVRRHQDLQDGRFLLSLWEK